MNKTWLSPKQLSERWGGSPNTGTLANWRNQNKGPKYYRLGTIRYDIKEVVKYEKSLK